MKNLKTNWLLRHALTVFSCVLIIVFGIAFLTQADPVTTTIGENIVTNDLSVTGNVTSGTWQGTAIADDYIASNANWNTAYGWGDWSGQGFITTFSTNTLTNKDGNISMWINDSGYLTSNETITLSGDVTGSGATAISTTLGTGIDVIKLANGSVSNAEFQYLNGATSVLQTQLDNKIAIPGSSAQGDILFRNDTDWTRLTVGNSGEFLKTQGASADPVWSAVSTTYARTATKVVCASGSVDTTNCDYLCSGNSDQSEINTAITAIALTGGSVVLMEGTYTISTPILMNTDNVALIGQGKGTKIQLATAVQSNIIESTGGHLGLLIADLYLDGTTSAASLNSDINQCGIYFNNVDDSKIENIYSLSNKRNGVNLYNGSERNEVIGCTVTGNSYRGITLFSSNFNEISGNMCKSNTNAGIYLTSSESNTISSNLCPGSQSEGIALYTTSRYNTITGNVYKDNTIEEIFIGNNCDFNTISGNICGSGNMGLWLSSADYNNVLSNIFYDNSSKNIRITGCIGSIIEGNIIYNSNDEGIQVDGSSYSSITGNNIYSSMRNGIYFRDYGVAYCQHNTISGNNIYHNGEGGNYDGIHFTEHSSYNNIQGNTIRSGTTHRYGIRIDSSNCTENLVINNDFYDAGATANFSDAGTGTIVKDNRGYNPVGVVSTPFDNTNHQVRLGGDAAGPTVASQDYEVLNTPCRVISTGGTDVDITIKDAAGTTISNPGATCSEWLEIGWKVNFGGFSVAPTVTVAFK